ncbi:MAG TPA: creatininase family protein [Chthonomonadaceae bacterium]|nr:creatininase family protein [Chthonomonadaceae bacterium]
MDSLDKILYDELTWPEINEAVQAGKVILLPIGSTEQHGHHLPLDTDNFLARSVCLATARRIPREVLVMPTIPYGYNEHALDFPGTIHVHYNHFIEYCLDVCKSVAYAGFNRMVLVDGHGSNEHLCEFIARRATLETDALVASTMWTNLAVEAFQAVRESGPGGAAHACELETSAYLYLDASRVQMDKAQDHYGGAAGKEGTRLLAVDLATGLPPIKVVRWTSAATPTGVSGAPTLATREKGQAVVEGAAENLAVFIREFRSMEKGARVDHRVVKPELPVLPSLDG